MKRIACRISRARRALLNSMRGALLACIAACACLAAAPAPAAAAPEPVVIESFSDLLAAVLASRTQDTSGMTYVLDLEDAPNKVLDLTSDQVDAIISQIGSLTFGSKDNPFRGTFDGAGYTIKGLNYERDLWVPAPDTGLFAWTDGAVIKNITFEDAYVGADYRGGVIVGCAKNTRIEHVKLVNCTSSVTPANNAVALITNAGLAGGMVAGELDGCSLYDVEVQGGRVVNNSTVAVSGLGGEGLYLGAIAGVAKNSTIEYSRVTPRRTLSADGGVTYSYTEVKNSYDVAVGAVAGQAVYAGGIAGSLYENASIIDCFSTAECHTYAATYVSVGAGNVGYVGGLAARTDDTTYLVRSHYAGNLHSKLYNAILVIPIIQNNMYLAGLIEWDDDDLASISDCYYNRARSDTPGTSKDIPAVGIERRDAGPSFGVVDNATYVDRLFWEEHGYDFEGGTARVTGALGGEEHVNKWVMDYDLGMPVHGDSVKATLDYPGAGTATIGASDVLATQKPQTTKVPQDFAVQGFVADDLDLDFTATVTPVSPETTPLVSDVDGTGYDNEGFAFRGWWREPGVTVNHIDDTHGFFDPIVSDEGKCVSTDTAYTARNRGPGSADGFAGNDLFVAYYQGQVLFHDAAGGVIELTGEPSTGTADDWYDHEAALPTCAEPVADRPHNGVSATARLIGWTCERNPDTGGGWPAVTSTALGDMKNRGHFFVAGDPIEQPMDLYPVYSDLTTNIVTVFEGHDQDALDDRSMREGVGRTDVRVADDTCTIEVSGALDGGALPEGYRFVGWYETDDEGKEWRVSSDASYTLPADVDLTREHVYTARFEYRVRAWLPTERPGHQDEYCYREYYEGSANPDIGLFETSWVPYGASGSDVAAAFDTPAVRDEFHYWTDHAAMVRYGAYADDHIVNLSELNDMRNHADELPDISASAYAVTAPCEVDAIVTYGNSNYDVVTVADFPQSTDKYNLRFFLSRGQIDVTAKPGYRISGILRFTTEINGFDTTSHYGHNSTQRLGWVGRDAVWDDIGDVYSMDHQNIYLLKASADVNFYDRDGALIFTPTSPRNLSDVFTSPDEPEAFPERATATRKFDSLVFNPAGTTTQAEVSPFTMLESVPFGELDVPVGLGEVDAGIDPVADGSAADPVTGDTTGRFICEDGVYYGFLGWVCPDELTDAERAHAFTGGAPALGSHGYVATSAANAAPYLLNERSRVKRSMDVCPVYAKFDIETTTNIERAGVPAGAGINVPADPACTVAPADGGFAAALSADVSTPVTTDGDELYRLTSCTVERADGSVEVLTPTGASDHEFSYGVQPGERYVFVANYEPLAVAYHTSEDTTRTVVRNSGDLLGPAPAGEPTFDMEAIDAAAGSRTVFLGWTEQAPAEGGEYVLLDEERSVELVNKGAVVQHAMELFAVYGTTRVTVRSNIDDVVGGDVTKIRAIERVWPDGASSNGDAALMLRAYPQEGYEFRGWYTGYVDADEPGTMLTAAPTHVLTASELAGAEVYTAVFERVHEVRYHDTDGSVLYTAKVADGSGRSFVTTVTGDDGVEQETVADPEAWRALAASLQQAADAPDARTSELVKEWQWVKADGSTVAWDAFCRVPIGQDMDVYPVTWCVQARDAASEVNTADLWWVLDASGASGQPVKAYFKNGYEQERLTVNVSEARYAPAAAGAPAASLSPRPGVPVGLFVAPTSTAPLVEPTDEKGDAVFSFDSTLTILKRTDDEGAAGKTFVCTVMDTVTREQRSVSIQMPDAPDASGMLVGKAVLDVPTGRYAVAEDAAWAWRYTAHMTGAGTDAAPGFVEVDVASAQTVTCTNELADTAWLDAADRAKNVFAPQGRAAAAKRAQEVSDEQ